ncbi:murein hydrolase activator EnvC family protein [Planosporangium sp. 12N6]|uniref:murein hydrolase activator EnvC family protein n=1 Tax=Planosporangium spinosum TaxID=3402278 RepID=UPI003CF56F69
MPFVPARSSGFLALAATLLLAVPAGPASSAPPRLPDPSPAPPRLPDPSPVPGRFGWPLDGPPPVARQFTPPPRPWLPGHRGVDLVGRPGVPVRAAGPGTVRFAGQVGGRTIVSVDHTDGLRTTYEPVTPTVVAGQVVRAGDPLGVLDAGHEGCPAAGCLHWGLRRGEVYLDPLVLVGRGRVRLLPLAV